MTWGSEHSPSGDLTGQVVARAQLAAQLARNGVPPLELWRQVHTREVQAQLVTASGEVYGPRRLDGSPVRSRVLPDGSRITLAGDTSIISAAQRRLCRVLLLVGVLAVAVAAAGQAHQCRRGDLSLSGHGLG